MKSNYVTLTKFNNFNDRLDVLVTNDDFNILK